jgi:precorrin-6Y C5,15-methyltransferase (decarboxylating)
VAILTDDRRSPSVIAEALLDHGVDDFRAYVCENVGGSNERIVESDLSDLVGQEFAALNVLLLLRDPTPSPCTKGSGRSEGRAPLLGIPDEAFHQRRPPDGLITKSEVRAVALAKLAMREDSVVWDIGAGSGSIAVEAARLAHRGQVFAVERNPAAVADIRQNVIEFGVPQVEVVEAEAPEGLSALPDPDAVFVGGSGRRLADILTDVCGRLRPGGRVVVSLATVENLNAALQTLRSHGYAAEVTQVSIARSRDVAGLTRLQALNPVFLVTGERMGTRE